MITFTSSTLLSCSDQNYIPSKCCFSNDDIVVRPLRLSGQKEPYFKFSASSYRNPLIESNSNSFFEGAPRAAIYFSSYVIKYRYEMRSSGLISPKR